MIDPATIQAALKKAGFLKGAIDGKFGDLSRAARDEALKAHGVNINGWPHSRLMIAINQWLMAASGISVVVDGFAGPSTSYALEQYQNALREQPAPAWQLKTMPDVFPRQKDMRSFYGEPGTGHTKLELPYPFRLAWDVSTVVSKITIHEKCAESAGRALAKALDHYGHEKIKELGLDLFGGCFNNRAMRGGTSLSTHAYAAALDFDPEHNQLRWGSDRARMAGAKYAPFLDAFEAEGWVSLGRLRNFDWMHLQAARL